MLSKCNTHTQTIYTVYMYIHTRMHTLVQLLLKAMALMDFEETILKQKL